MMGERAGSRSTEFCRGTLCLTLDNMGRAKEVGEGKTGLPDPLEPGLAIGYPRLLGLLDDLNVKATFFVEGWNCLHHPGMVRELAGRGHDVGLHGWVHETFGELGLARAQQVLHDGTAAMRGIGIDPKGFRAPGGVRGPFATPLLLDLGYEFDSSIEHSHSQEIAREIPGPHEPHLMPSGLVNVPWRWSSIDVIHYFRQPSGPGTPRQLETEWREKLDGAKRDGSTFTVIVHPYVTGTDEERFQAFSRFLKAATEDDLVDILSAREVARRVIDGAARPTS